MFHYLLFPTFPTWTVLPFWCLLHGIPLIWPKFFLKVLLQKSGTKFQLTPPCLAIAILIFIPPSAVFPCSHHHRTADFYSTLIIYAPDVLPVFPLRLILTEYWYILSQAQFSNLFCIYPYSFHIDCIFHTMWGTISNLLKVKLHDIYYFTFVL